MNSEEFKLFRHRAVHSLKHLNEKCFEEFGVSKWPRYDYDVEKETLTFAENDVPKVKASIQVVGTTSNKAKNWLWGWANAHFPSHSAAKIQAVRSFGETNGIKQLTEPYWPDDEYHGWEMTAIAAQIVGAKAAYRCPGNDGFIYFAIMDIGFASTDGVSDKPDAECLGHVKCGDHGTGYETFICEHLAANPQQEWFSDSPSESNPWPDSWCAQCNEAFKEEGEWNVRNESRMKIKLLCHRCYEAARNLRAH